MTNPNKKPSAKTLPQAVVRELGDLAIIDLRRPDSISVSAESANAATAAAKVAENYDVANFSLKQGPAGYELARWQDGEGAQVVAGARGGVVEQFRVDLPPAYQKAA